MDYSEDYAKRLDQQDELSRFREKFFYPKLANGGRLTYLCGNSLGLQPKKAREFVNEEMDKWAKMGVEGHFEGVRPWATLDEEICLLLCDILGGKEDEIVVMNSLTTNIHLLLAAFYRPKGKRRKILIESQAFTSDHHVVRSQIEFHGFNPSECLLEVECGENGWVKTENILRMIEEHGDEIALVFIGAVQFYSGQFFEMEKITKAAKEHGCMVGFDLAHATGNVVLKLHEWNVDFAAGCTYKYLNSGPGAIGFAYVHESWDTTRMKIFRGWWGQKLEARFNMSKIHQSIGGARAFQLSNPTMLSAMCLHASLLVFKEAGIEALRKKSVKLTGYLEDLLKHRLKGNVKLLTPSDPAQRGCQLSLYFDSNIDGYMKFLSSRGVIVDERRPNVIRVAPAPLYNSFHDVWIFVDILKQAVASGHNKL